MNNAVKIKMILCCLSVAWIGGCTGEPENDGANKPEKETIKKLFSTDNTASKPKKTPMKNPNPKKPTHRGVTPPSQPTPPTPPCTRPRTPPPPKTCVASAAKAAAYCTDQLTGVPINPQVTCEQNVGGEQPCDYTAATLVEKCTRTDPNTDWVDVNFAINSDRDFCVYLSTDAAGDASDANCDSIHLPQFTDPGGDPEPICAHTRIAYPPCMFLGNMGGDLPATWNDNNYCNDIVNPGTRGGLSFQQACEAAVIVIQKNETADAIDPEPTNDNKDGLRFCTYKDAHPHTCTPHGDVCAGQSKVVCEGALREICDWK